MLLTLVNFFLRFFRSALTFFAGVPGKIALLVGALGSIVVECRTFSNRLEPYFDSFFNGLDTVFAQLSALVGDNSIFSLLSYCFAFDVLVGIVADVLSFVAIVTTFLFVGFLHVLIIYFGLRFAFSCYKFLLRVTSNGLAGA